MDQEIREIADRVLGAEDALNETDAVLVELVASYVRRLPALGQTNKVMLAAIVGLSQHEPDFARSLMAELG